MESFGESPFEFEIRLIFVERTGHLSSFWTRATDVNGKFSCKNERNERNKLRREIVWVRSSAGREPFDQWHRPIILLHHHCSKVWTLKDPPNLYISRWVHFSGCHTHWKREICTVGAKNLTKISKNAKSAHFNYPEESISFDSFDLRRIRRYDVTTKTITIEFYRIEHRVWLVRTTQRTHKEKGRHGWSWQRWPSAVDSTTASECRRFDEGDASLGGSFVFVVWDQFGDEDKASSAAPSPASDQSIRFRLIVVNWLAPCAVLSTP